MARPKKEKKEIDVLVECDENDIEVVKVEIESKPKVKALDPYKGVPSKYHKFIKREK